MSEKKTLFPPIESKLDRLFLGGLDDSVSRYPWADIKADIENLNRSLVYYALLGPRLCCRIGNILYHKKYFVALTNPKTSPLFYLAKSGFFQFQMKKETINETIAYRESIHTNSTLAFIKSNGWRKGSKIYRQIEEIDKQLPTGHSKISYSAKFNHYFQSLVNEIDLVNYPSFAEIFRRWNKEFAGYERTRSNFEELAKAKFSTDPFKLSQAMSVINSVNHYAYGLGLKKNFPNVAIETNQLLEMQKYTKTYFGQEERFISAERVKELVNRGVLDTIEDNLKVPEKLLYDYKCWEKLGALAVATPETEKQIEFENLKQQLIININRLNHTKDVTETQKRIEEVSRELGEFISTELGLKKAKKISAKYSLTWGKIGGAVTGITTGSLSQPYIQNVAHDTISKGLEQAGIIALSLVAGLCFDKISSFVSRSIDEARAQSKDFTKNEIKNISKAIGCLSVRLIDGNLEKK